MYLLVSGYIDFRVGVDENDNKSTAETTSGSNKIVAVERSHLLVWQVNTKSLET